MLASELIAKMRSRLRDETSEYWSDPELIDSINFALSAMAHRLMPWKGRYQFSIIDGIDTYALPVDYLAPISVVHDDGVYPILGTMQALHSSESGDPSVFIDNDAIIISPIPDVGTIVYVNYHALLQIDDAADTINISTAFIDTVLSYALSLALQKQSSEESLAQSKYYLQLYETRCADIAHVAHMRRNSTSIISRYQKV